MNFTVSTNKILNVIVPSITLGFAVYYVFNHLGWWNPLFSGVSYGVFTALCVSVGIAMIEKEWRKNEYR